MTTVAQECSVDGCDLRVKGRGMCDGHYDDARRGRQFKEGRHPRGNPKTCTADGCNRRQDRGGMCASHNNRLEKYGVLNVEDVPKRIDPGCDVDGCDRPFYGLNYCSAHWQQLKAGKIPGSIRGSLKPCFFVGCGRTAVFKGYCQSHKWQIKNGLPLRPIKKKRTVWDRTGTCIVPDCAGNLEKNHRMCEAHRRYDGKFNLSDDMVVALFSGGVRCGICGSEYTGIGRHYHLDHDHNCCPANSGCDNCVRGFLCPQCNHGLGFFRDDTRLLSSAINYLERSKR